MNRRTYIKALAAAASLGVFLWGYWPVVDKIISPKRQPYGPNLQPGLSMRHVHSVCQGCNVGCGIRARVVNYKGVEVIERIEGNPYHVNNRAVSVDKQVERYDPLPYNTPVKEALDKWSGMLCAKGADGIHYVYDPYRVLKPLKRAGPRGSGKWKEITWEQLINEVVNGGVIEETGERLPGLKEFFVYGKLREAGFDPNAVLSEMKKDVDNILNIAKDPKTTYDDVVKAIEEFKAKWQQRLGEKGLKLEDVLIDPDRPDLGTKANMVVYIRGNGQHFADTFSRRWINAFGSVNWVEHSSPCRLGFVTGNDIWAGVGDLNGDAMGAKVVIAAGWTMGRHHPGTTGQGAIVEKACEGKLKWYYVNPVAPRTTCRGNVVWVPVKPGEDAALAFAVIRWLIENKRYNEEFLSIPNSASAKKLGYPVNTNATWLVIVEGSRFGEFLKARDVGIENSDKPVVWTGERFATYDSVDKADLYYVGKVTLSNGEAVAVKTAFMILRDEAFSKSFEEWLAIVSPYSVGTPEFADYVKTVEQMAKDFADAAPAASTLLARGAGMHTNGEYTVWAYRMLDTLIGNFHRKGGQLGPSPTTSDTNYIYNVGVSGFGEPMKWGPPIDRATYAYENTLEYWLRVKKALKEGKTGEEAIRAAYPTKRPWYSRAAKHVFAEVFAGIAESYPYRIGALIMFFANPVSYGVKFVEVLKDPAKLPLFIAITTTINETAIYADYIVPDTTYLETGNMGVQNLYAPGDGALLAEGWRSPVIMPLTQYIGDCPNGHPRYASFWEFFIDVAKKLSMPGFGDKAIPGTKGKKYEGRWFSLHCAWEAVMRTFANAALNAKDLKLIPENVPDEEVKFVEDNYPIARFKDILPPDEWRYVAYGLARGGVFIRYEDSFDERGISKRKVPGRGTLYLWSEEVAKTRNSVTGEKFWGGPKYFPIATYAPVGSASQRVDKWLSGTPLRQLYPPGEWPFTLISWIGPVLTERHQFFYWPKQVVPENFVLINPVDAAKLGIETGDVVRVETPTGFFEAPAVVEATVIPGVVVVPYVMGRWADTVVKKPTYFALKGPLAKFVEELPDRVEIPADAVNPVKNLPDLVKKILFTKSPADYYNGLAVDEWRFSGVMPDVVGMSDISLGEWPLLSWLSGAQAFFDVPARISKTGKRHEFKVPYIVW